MKDTTAKVAGPGRGKPAREGTTADLSPVSGIPHPALTLISMLDEARLSQTKAAHAMGVAPMTVNRLCNGHGLPTARMSVLFAQAVGKPAADVWRAVCDYELAVALRDAKARRKK